MKPDAEAPCEAEPRQQYANKCELLLSLTGWAVGLGNVWRFPSLTFENGGAAFLIPYFLSLVLIGLPLFILELGLGQIYRQGPIGLWKKLGLPRLQGIGLAATLCTYFVTLYYIVILAWTGYYIARTFGGMPSGELPWTDQVSGYKCPVDEFHVDARFGNKSDLFLQNGLYNPVYEGGFFCDQEYKFCKPPAKATVAQLACEDINDSEGCTSVGCVWTNPLGHVKRSSTADNCPARAAVTFWEKEVLGKSSGMDNFEGMHGGLLVSLTICWIAVYLVIFKGVASSGKVVYVTVILPYVVLVAFLLRALTLPNAGTGLKFFLMPDFSKILEPMVWIRAANQIFYSIGVGFGVSVSMASYGNRRDNFVGNAVKVACINSATSILAGFVVFPILGYLAKEMSVVHPCITGDDVSQLKTVVGISGASIAFIAFPIAISRMPWPFFWAMLFFIMLVSLGIDSQFAAMENVMTVVYDSGMTRKLSKPKLAAVICSVNWLVGLIFITFGGIYWFNLFDYYSCVIVLFVVALLECVGLMWVKKDAFEGFKTAVFEATGVTIGKTLTIMWKFVDPLLLLVLCVMSLLSFDLMKAKESKPYPDGTGYLPEWSIFLGWMLALSPLVAGIVMACCLWRRSKDSEASIAVAPEVIGTALGDNAVGPKTTPNQPAAFEAKPASNQPAVEGFLL